MQRGQRLVEERGSSSQIPLPGGTDPKLGHQTLTGFQRKGHELRASTGARAAGTHRWFGSAGRSPPLGRRSRED